MKKLKRICFSLFSLALIILGGVCLVPSSVAEAESVIYNGSVDNNVVFVTFSDGDTDWVNETPSPYSSNIMELMENSYNTSISSVKNYYKALSFNDFELKSNFYLDNAKAYKVPYTKNELLPYSKTNAEGYLEYDVCSYSSSTVPSQLSMSFFLNTTHLFSCYDCGNAKHDGSGANCDLSYSSTDDIACLCAYYIYQAEHPKTYNYEHLERYIREQVALKTVLQNISSFTGSVDNNSDGQVDALTFIFPNMSESIGWSDLLWPHQLVLADLSSLAGYSSYLVNILNAHKVRNVSQSDLNLLFKNIQKNGATCYSYNLYTFSHLLFKYSGEVRLMQDKDGLEVISNYTLTHELGHVLGLPDYYVYDDDENEDAVYCWDLMAYSYHGTPLYTTTYNREKLGFAKPNNIVTLTHEGTYELYPTCYDEVNNNNENSENVLAFVYQDSRYPGQKIYMEYRTMEGNFESGISKFITYRRDGLIVYRIDENVKQASGYDSMLSSGNFYGYPYNMYVFRNKNSFAINSENTSLSNITFQTYDATKDQSELRYEDVTFTDSGLNIEFVKVENGKISFTITGGQLTPEDNRDISQITLKGNSQATIEVGSTSYTDAGVNFGEYSQDEFNMVIQDKVDTTKLGTYTYVYILTLKADTSKVVRLTRTVKVVDTQAPTVELIGKENINVANLADYVEQGINYSDNYDKKDDLTVNISSPEKLSENYYKITYSVTDKSGNTTTIYRYIIIKPVTDFTSVRLVGTDSINHDVGNIYTDSGINYGNFTSSDFSVEAQNDINVNKLGTYHYRYKLTYLSTGEVIELVRTVMIVDRVNPTIALVGAFDITLSNIEGYEEKGVTYSDNYDAQKDLTLTIGELELVSENRYRIKYVVTDSSNNSSTVYRYIQIEPNLFSSVTLRGESEISIDVKTSYTDAGVSFGGFSSSDFEMTTQNDVNISVLGEYLYTYTLTYVSTGEKIKLSRKVVVKDNIAPSIYLRGNKQIEKYLSEVYSYSDKNVLVSDNYYSESQIQVVTHLEKVNEETYYYYYKAIDGSGNESEEIFRIIKVIIKPLLNSQIDFKLNNSDTLAESYYTEKLIKFNVVVNYNADNAPNQTAKMYINGEKVGQTSGNCFYYEFSKGGQYRVRIEVGNAYCEKVIEVRDLSEATQTPADNTMVVALSCTGGGILLMSLIIAIAGRKSKYKYLDRY